MIRRKIAGGLLAALLAGIPSVGLAQHDPDFEARIRECAELKTAYDYTGTDLTKLWNSTAIWIGCQTKDRPLDFTPVALVIARSLEGFVELPKPDQVLIVKFYRKRYIKSEGAARALGGSGDLVDFTAIPPQDKDQLKLRFFLKDLRKAHDRHADTAVLGFDSSRELYLRFGWIAQGLRQAFDAGIAAQVDRLEAVPGASVTKPGAKVAGLVERAAAVSVFMLGTELSLDIEGEDFSPPTVATLRDKALRTKDKQVRRDWSRYHGLLQVLWRFERRIGRLVDKAIKKVGKGGPEDPLPAGWPATLAPGTYHVLRATDFFSVLGVPVTAWTSGRVGLIEIDSPEKLWTEANRLIGEAESDFEGVFAPYYRLTREWTGEDWRFDLLADRATVGAATKKSWEYRHEEIGVVSHGYHAATRSYEAGASTVDVTVFFFKEPPLSFDFLALPGGEYEVRAVLRNSGLKPWPEIPLGNFRNDDPSEFWDGLTAELTRMKADLATYFDSIVAGRDEPARNAYEKMKTVLSSCAVTTPPVYDGQDAPLHFLRLFHKCLTDDPAGFKGRSAEVAISFRRIGP